MSYLVLARKWRPQTFDDLVGQKHIGRTLEKAIATGRVHHAFLFTGTRGVGKTTSARILAMALNCEKGPTANPCGVCGSCKQIKSGSGLDVMEIDGASNRGIDDIRNLREQISYTPAGGKFRIVIIDEVHMLTKEAFNALLKSLEEPPPNFIFIFATTDPNKVPETILSRIQRYDFKRISAEDIFDRLKYICTEEKIGFEEPALRFVAQKANGSRRDALTLLDQVIPFCKDGITIAELKPVLGLLDQSLFIELFNSIQEKNEAELLQKTTSVLAEGIDLGELANGLTEHVRNLLLSKIPNISRDVLLLSEAETKACAQQAAKFEAADLLRISDLLSSLTMRLTRSPMPRFELEAALLKMARLDKAVDIAKLLDGSFSSDSKKKTEYAPPQPLTQPTNIPLPPEPPEMEAPEKVSSEPLNLSPTAMASDWKLVIRTLSGDLMQIGTFLSLSNVSHADDREIHIMLPPNHKFQHSQLSSSDNTRKIEEWFKKKMNYHGRVLIKLTPESGSAGATGGQQQSGPVISIQKKTSINDAIKKEPIIGSILDEFEGEVIG
ncbi:MAG: DNA polymerase III subunit gamma/tau [Fibrobacteres bacterium]|nr:DNA polymerase III subunit gamma/tau [Fibrobacterota bacterium]